ncbi:hypothetical protein [Nonomuraea zeae]|uniref:hypothetical protein n=1 Tax=Nonomuraea zeae TaxID=1642303 RepID=UPI00361357BB
MQGRVAGGGVVQSALGGELFQQELRPDLVEPRGLRVLQDGVEFAGAVEALDPLPDGLSQAAQPDGSEGMHTVLQRLLVAEDSPEGGLHTWPHGRKVSMPDQDPEPVPRVLWISPAARRGLWITQGHGAHPIDGQWSAGGS